LDVLGPQVIDIPVFLNDVEIHQGEFRFRPDYEPGLLLLRGRRSGRR
jgi:hypothetical protein